MDFSNKTLALLLVVTLVISMTGTLLSLNRLESFNYNPLQVSGRLGSDIGNVTLQINQSASLIFQINTINFGSGLVNASGGFVNCTLNSEGIVQYVPANCVGFNNVTQGLVLMNDGNRNLSVTLQSNVNSSDFIGGIVGGGPQFAWNITNNETGACQTGLFKYNATWQPVNKTPDVVTICTDMNWQDSADTFLIHVQVRIPGDSFGGQRNATFTATGTGL